MTFDEWAIVEFMGHRRLAGKLTEAEIAGVKFLRLDVPTRDGGTTTQFYSASSVYAITPTTEETVRQMATLQGVAPVHRWELPAPPPDRDQDDAQDADEDDRDVEIHEEAF